jgi:hypothetical protein
MLYFQNDGDDTSLNVSWYERKLNAYPNYRMYLKNKATHDSFSLDFPWFNDLSLYPTRYNKFQALVEDKDPGQYNYDVYEYLPGGQNLIPNNRFIGAIAGISGTPPTGMTINTPTSFQREILGINVINNIPCLSIRFFGTFLTGTGSLTISYGSLIRAFFNQVYNHSVYLSRTGTFAGGVIYLQSDLTTLSTYLSTISSSPFTITNVLTRHNFNMTLNQSQVALINAYVSIQNLVNGGVYDFVMNVGLPQVSLGNTLNAPIQTTGTARNAQAINFVPNGLLFNAVTGVTTANNADTPIAGIQSTLITKSLAGSGYFANQICLQQLPIGSTTYTISRYFKYNGVDFATSMEFNNGSQWGGITWRCRFNITSTGVTIVSVANCSASVTNEGNGWYRVAVTINVGTTPSGAISVIYLMQMDNALPINSSFLTAAPQLEFGAVATEYINTTGVVAARFFQDNHVAIIENGNALVAMAESPVYDYDEETTYVQY